MSRVLGQIHESIFALQTFNITRFSAFFLVSVFLVKIRLEVDQIADYEYVLFLSSIVTGWWIHGFLQSYMADSSGLDDLEKNSLFKDYSRIFLVFGSAIVLLVAFIIELLAFWQILQDPPPGFYYFLIFHFILQASLLIVYYFHLRKWTRAIYLMAVYFLIAYIGSFSLLLWDGTSLPLVYSFLAGSSLLIIAIWIFLYRQNAAHQNLRATRRYIPQLSILMLIQGIGFISLWSDGFWVQYFYGTDEMFALFRYGGREFPLFIILTTTFSTAIIHEASHAGGLERIKATSRQYIWMFLPMALLLLLSSQFLFTWVYHEEFRPASFIFDLYLLLVVVRVLFSRTILIANRYFSSLLWISVAELLINMVASFAFYWYWGILGLVLGSLVAHVFEMAITILIVRKKLNIPIKNFIPVRAFLFFAIILAVAFTVKYGLFHEDWIGKMVGR